MEETNEVAISVSNVSKTFKLPHEKQSSIKGLFLNMFKGKHTYEKQRVLKNISFEIKKGEFFGIVGRNGSGKSTLLKLLAGIYTADRGNIQVRGKLVPFIELGVGFNPELTGRENVFLNGALLGFNRKEMDEMYNEIVEFAELKKFMDQKLKNYSSGMQVRLAFSIAIRANSDILVLDEVLAVGDEAFQRKCNDHFKKLKEEGKTVILVTHSMESVRRFCTRAMLLHNGVIKAFGTPEDVANQYTIENVTPTSNLETTNKVALDDGLSERVPYFKITTNNSKVLSSDDKLNVKISYKITDSAPVNTKISIIDEGRGGYAIVQNGATAIAKKGLNTLEYEFPLYLYNDTTLKIIAVLDEEETNNRIAFTNDRNSSRVVVRNSGKFSGAALLRREGDFYGRWKNGQPEL